MEKMASEVDAGGTLTLKGTPLAELRVTDLKRELEHRGLSKSGSKIQLIERLKAQLLLEKLQQEAAQSSGDEHEGKVPNIALQQDDKAGQSEFVRQYLQQQQRNLEIQMEVKKQFEEERKRRSADESSADDDPGPTNVADDNPELTSPRQFKDDTSNAPAKEPSKMPRPIRKSNRNSLKGESGPLKDQDRSRPESPKLTKERQRRRSSSSQSSRSPSPDQPSQNRRGRPARAAARKVERSRSSSSSSTEESPKKKQRSRNNSSSDSGSRSPNTTSSKMHAQKPRRRSDTDQAAEKDIPYDGSGDKSVGKDENSDKAMAASSRKKWRKKQPPAPALVESTNASQRKDSATADDTKERQSPRGENTNGKEKSDKLVEEEQDVREVVSGSRLSTAVASLPAEKSGTSSGKTQEAASGLEKSKLISEENSQKQEHSSKQKDEEDERIVETASAKGPHKSPGRQRSRSSDSSSAGSKSRSRSPTRKKGQGSRSSPSSSSDSETRSSDSSSDSSVDGSHKTASKANGQAQTPGRKVSLTQEKGDQAEQMEVEVTSKSPTSSKTGHTERDYKQSSVWTSPSGEPRSKSQEEKQNNLDKEPDNRSTEAKEERGDTHRVLDENNSMVTVSSEKAKDADEETAAKKGVKRRKWNSKASKAGKTTKRTSSMEISSDVLKNLIGDVKLTETVFEMETEVVNDLDYDDQEEDQRDVRVKKAQSPNKEEKPEEEDARRVETRDASPESAAATASEPEKKIIKLSSAAPKIAAKTKVKKSKSDKKGDAAGKKEKKQDAVADTEPKEKVIATNRVIKPLMPVVDEPEPVTGRQSPARNPPDRVIRIAGLVRPFTVNQLKELLRRSGELDDEYFWISDIKSHCLAAYKTPEQATAARAALHGTRWPQSNPKILFVDFATIDDVIHRKQEGKGPPPALNKRPQEEQKIKEPKIVEKEEKKHKTKEPKEKGRVEREKEERETKDRKREPEKKNFVREWDRDKIQQLSRSRSKSKDRERPARRSRSREREQRKRGEYKDKREEERRKEKKQKEAKAEEEPPAKLLDDLFRKTKATPCIYWLPLTEEQAQVRMAKRLEEEKERQKKIAAAEEREKEELKKREAARLERQRERERAREKDRDRDRSKPERKASRSSSRSRSRRRR